MKNLIAILAISSYWLTPAAAQYFTKKDSIAFAPDSSYSRAVQRSGKSLVFATSKSGVIEWNEQTGVIRQLIPPSKSGEYRDIIVSGTQVIGLVSGKNGELRTTPNDLILLQKGLFFDAMDQQANSLVVLADPVDGFFRLFRVDLNTTKSVPVKGPAAIGDEACYAASGTTVALKGDSIISFISGGSTATRVHRSENGGRTWASSNLPMTAGEGCGPFSLYFVTDKLALIAGGCYTQPYVAQKTLYSTDGGNTWNLSETTVGGYRSAICGNELVQFACGTNGIDISTDGGKNWKLFDAGNFCALLLEKNKLYATTNKGKCIRYKLKGEF